MWFINNKMLLSSSIIILIGLAIVYAAGSYLTSTHPSKVGAIPDDFPAINVSFPSKSGSTLAGWYLAGQTDKGGVLLMHGIKSNRLQMVERARFLHQAGYSVLLFDFQGHGESLGEKVTFGYLEALDAEAAYAFLHDKLQHKSIGVIGVSLGGAAALLGSVATQADALVLESVYPTIEEAIVNRLTLYLGEGGAYLLPLLLGQVEPRLGFSPDVLRPIDYLSKVTGAVFIITGSEDKHTTLSESKRLFSAANEPKKWWVVEGASHINFSHYEPEAYRLKVLAFFERALIYK